MSVAETAAAPAEPARTHPWWKVTCLTGVDYFSTLGYQPGIAFLAAGILSPLATLVLVLVTLGVALPVYREVARRSPHGHGSIRMLEELLPRWRGKAAVLVLLGFAATDFIITITLSAADAADHIIHNPLAPAWLDHPVPVALALVAALGGVFLAGVPEAIGVAVAIVAGYLAMNVLLIGRALAELLAHPDLLPGWSEAALRLHPEPAGMALACALLFPRLALGLSGFETGVMVMPLVRGAPGDTEQAPAGRIANTRKLLASAALIMSALLVSSSLVTTLLVPAPAFESGGEANGRALAYLAHHLLGPGFGSAYDAVTIAILWYAGASAMAGLLNLVPRYLPPYGMAPEWAGAHRPLVYLFTATAASITVVFEADVDAQAGAYATGVLVLMTSAALAVTLAHPKGHRARWWAMTAVFAYTTVENVISRPEGLQIGGVFIATIVVASLLSRAFRTTELRVRSVSLTGTAAALVDEVGPRVRLVAHRPDKRSAEEYARKEQQARDDHSLDSGELLLFLEVTQGDASEFAEDLEVRGVRVGPHRILRCRSAAVPNAIAALLLHLQQRTGRTPDAYFGWTEGNPLSYVLRYVFLGEGDTAPMTREVLRRAIREPRQRPRVHVS